MKTKFMNQHPLRKTLNKEDWIRIDQVLKSELPDDQATPEEFEAATDVFYDATAARSQTHLGVLTLQ